MKKPQHHDYHSHSHTRPYDHHSDFTSVNNKYQQFNSGSSSTSSGSSGSSASSSSGENQEFLPRPEHHLRETPTSTHQENTKLFSPYQSELPYQQQHQLHHQQQYAQLRRELLTRQRMRSSSEESEADSSEFRPIMNSAEYMSPSSNVETVVPPPPNGQTRTSFHINVPEREDSDKEASSNSGHSINNNQYTHNIEIPVHFYRLQPLENGEGFAITS